MIHFEHPLALLLLVPLAVFAFWLARRGRPAAIAHSNIDLIRAVTKTRRTRWARLLLALRWVGAALLVVALARPDIIHHHGEVQSSGIDVMLVIDVSGSMQARDMAESAGKRLLLSRLDAAKQVVSRFVEDRANDRIGLIAFSGEPYLVSPLTLDHDWLLQNLERLNSNDLRDGTAIGSALAAGVRRLDAQPAKSKVLVLLTDGENNAGKITPRVAAETAKALGVKVYTIGIGSNPEALVPVTGENGRVELVRARMDVDATSLKEVASATGGKFYRAADTDSLRRVYGEIDRLEKTTHTFKGFSERTERFAWFAIPGLFALCAELGLSATRFRRVP